MGYVNTEYRSVSDSLGIVANWMGALQGHGELTDVLNELMVLTHADAAMIVRATQAENKVTYVARCNAQTGKAWPVPVQSHGDAIMGEGRFSSKAGSIWKLTEARSSELLPRQGEATPEIVPEEIREAVIISLLTENGHADSVELHFRKTPAQHNLDLIVMLTSTLSTCWRRRLPGVVARRAVRTRLRDVSAQSDSGEFAVLDIKNPARLSRCEFRVCTLLGEGMTVKSIAESLSVCQATVRSHLGSIFSKTGTSSQIELLHLINKSNENTRVRVA